MAPAFSASMQCKQQTTAANPPKYGNAAMSQPVIVAHDFSYEAI